MKILFYNIVENITKSKLTHVKLQLIDATFTKILDNNPKLKIGTALEDSSDNIFRVTGYYGDYIVLHSDKLGKHPVGKYLFCKQIINV